MATKENLSFKIHTPNFLKEITDNAIGANGKMGVLFVPMNTFRSYLLKIAKRASQLNDPKLNDIMCDMVLYEIADPESSEYNPELVSLIKQKATE